MRWEGGTRETWSTGVSISPVFGLFSACESGGRGGRSDAPSVEREDLFLKA